MIYVISFLSGIVNGFFTTGAGQILIFYLVFIKKEDTKKSRAVSIVVLSIVSIITLFMYLKQVYIDKVLLILIVITSLFGGYIGSKIMQKIKSNILNLISGILVTVLSAIKLIQGVM